MIKHKMNKRFVTLYGKYAQYKAHLLTDKFCAHKLAKTPTLTEWL